MTPFDSMHFDPERYPMPATTVVAADALPEQASDVVIGMTGEHTQLVGVTSAIEALVDGDLREALLAEGAGSKKGTVVSITGPVRVVCVGTGTDEIAHEERRWAAACAIRWINTHAGKGERHVALSLDASTADDVRAVTEGAVLGGETFMKLGKEPSAQPVRTISILSDAPEADQASQAGLITARSVMIARDWDDMPPNLMAPEHVVAQTRELVADQAVEVRCWDEDELRAGGFNGILAVGGGSARPPRLLRLDYAPEGARTHLMLVGKGITYDSGGYNLKQASSLLTMKHDMSGAAAVIAAVHAIAERGLPIRVTAYAALAEQMISGTAYRPSDVITMLDGTTVENRNSDAEGRIVLADALVQASSEKPDMIVDIATLTGGCVRALGHSMAGLMTSDDSTARTLLDAGERAGERYWHLPITEEVRENLPSTVADLQSSASPVGGTLFAAAFLQHFVDPHIPWAHLDIAGPGWVDGSAKGYLRTGSTGFGVRTLVALAETLA